jgi:hypothetical protein
MISPVIRQRRLAGVLSFVRFVMIGAAFLVTGDSSPPRLNASELGHDATMR